MTVLRAGPLVAWTNAWLAGLASSDEVLAAATGGDSPHRVRGLDLLDDTPLSEVLIRWRRLGAPVRLCLPVAGDVRGLPGPPDLRAAALDAGEAAWTPGLGLVPEITEYYPSSAPTTVVWQAFDADAVPDTDEQLADAQYALGEAVRGAATALSAADVAGASEDVATLVRRARRAGEQPNLPPGFPARAVALVAETERLQAILDVASLDPVGGAVDRFGISARESALRPLATAVRRARQAAYNARVG